MAARSNNSPMHRRYWTPMTTAIWVFVVIEAIAIAVFIATR